MNDKQQAAADLLWLAQRLRGIIALADDLNVLGSLDQAESEVKGRIKTAHRDAEAQRKALLDRTAQEIGDQKAAAGVVAANMRSAARADADKIIKKAQDKADDITAAATAEVQKSALMLADINSQIEAKKAELSRVAEAVAAAATQMAQEIEDKKHELVVIGTQVAQAQAGLDEAQTKHDRAQAEYTRIKQMIEGIRL